MERSQSYTSFETTGYSRNCINNNNNNHNNNNNNNNYHLKNASLHSHSENLKNKFASTSSLNLRKALELRQTQLQLQQQQEQRMLLQRQQWQLLFEQRQKQQQFLQKQQQFHLHHSASSENLDAPPSYLSSINNLQLLQQRRQKLLQRQKSNSSADDLSFQLHNGDDDDDDDLMIDDCIYDVTLRNSLLNISCFPNDIEDHPHHQQQQQMSQDNTSSPVSMSNETSAPIPQRLLKFQRQRPHSDAAINFRTSSPIPSPSSSSPTSTIAAAEAARNLSESATCSPPLRDAVTHRRLQQFEQALSFDSAVHSNSSNNTMTSTTTTTTNGNMSPLSPRHPHFGKLKRDNSLHSDSSRYSSVDSLLEARKPDPEAILINLGFGPVGSEDILSRIPKRFLKPSQVRGIDTEAFIRRLQLANSLADHSVLGYRGLIGNPDLPPSTIVAKIMQRFEVNERKKSMGSIEQTLR